MLTILAFDVGACSQLTQRETWKINQETGLTWHYVNVASSETREPYPFSVCAALMHPLLISSLWSLMNIFCSNAHLLPSFLSGENQEPTLQSVTILLPLPSFQLSGYILNFKAGATEGFLWNLSLNCWLTVHRALASYLWISLNHLSAISHRVVGSTDL